MLTSRKAFPALVLFPLLALAGCSDTAGPDGGALEVLAFARGPAVQRSVASLSAPNAAAAVVAPGTVDAVRIDRILLVLGRVKLEKAGDTPTDFVDERSVVISLTPNGTPAELLSLDIPTGEYQELELAFDKLERGHAQEELLIQQHPALADRSLLIEGTVSGDGGSETFSFTADLDLDVEVQLLPPHVVDPAAGDALWASIVVDIEGWMLDATGRLLDPREPAARSTIEGNVQHSAELFEDPDRDGR